MHASIWQFKGNPDELLGSYEAMVAEIPAANMRVHHAAFVDGQRRSSAS